MEQDQARELQQQAAWDVPVVRCVEVNLPGWLQELTGRTNWEVVDEELDDNFISYAMRQGKQQAEVTLYHDGHAVVDVDGKSLFDGTLTAASGDWAHLSYYHAESGEAIMLN